MLERISGKLVEIKTAPSGFIIIDVSGFFLEIHYPGRSIDQLPKIGSELTVPVKLFWSESGPRLFGFNSNQERSFFELLVSVPKLGPRTAHDIISSQDFLQVAEMIFNSKNAGLQKLPGVGKSLAARLITELKDKVGGQFLVDYSSSSNLSSSADIKLSGSAASQQYQELKEALVTNFGFSRMEADGLLSSSNITPEMDYSEAIKAVLQMYRRTRSK